MKPTESNQTEPIECQLKQSAIKQRQRGKPPHSQPSVKSDMQRGHEIEVSCAFLGWSSTTSFGESRNASGSAQSLPPKRRPTTRPTTRHQCQNKQEDEKSSPLSQSHDADMRRKCHRLHFLELDMWRLMVELSLLPNDFPLTVTTNNQCAHYILDCQSRDRGEGVQIPPL